MQGMIAPALWLAPPLSLLAAFLRRDGRLSIGGTGKAAGCNPAEMLGYLLGLFGLRCRVRPGLLLGQLTGTHHQKPHGLLRHPAVSVFDIHHALYALAPPASGCVALGAAWFFH
jgi:hypothetical protein